VRGYACYTATTRKLLRNIHDGWSLRLLGVRCACELCRRWLPSDETPFRVWLAAYRKEAESIDGRVVSHCLRSTGPDEVFGSIGVLKTFF
jgi:signal transduction histidine kinase